jgi:hypothetical protein
MSKISLLRLSLSMTISLVVMAPVLASLPLSMDQQITREQAAFDALKDTNFDASAFRPLACP